MTLYGLSILIPLHPCTISALHIRTLVLHTLPFRVSNHNINNFLSNIIPPEIIPPPHVQCISNCFTLQPLPDKYTLYTAYQQDSNTNIFIDRLIFSAPLDQFTILSLPVAYRIALYRD